MMTNSIQHTAYSTLAKDFGLKVDAPLTDYTSFKVGGPADLLALPDNQEQLSQLLKATARFSIPVTLFGGGTNLLITDKGIRGLVIITRQLKSNIKIKDEDLDNKTLSVEIGHRLSTLCKFAIDHSLSGLEFAAGIPGTVGGAIAMNAGTPSGQISDIIESINVWEPETQEFITHKKDTLNFSYRNLDISGLISEASFKLKKGNQKEIQSAFEQTLKQKKSSQPVSVASAGCFFKNPPKGMPAGELIEKSGLKGIRINDAMVSKHHANYIINMGNATSKDILLLKQQIQDTVLKKFHINLETEVRVEGE